MISAIYASVKVPQWYAVQGSDTTMMSNGQMHVTTTKNY